MTNTKTKSVVEVIKVLDAKTITQALEVIEDVYCNEKQWIRSAKNQIPDDITDTSYCSWFLAMVNDVPAGVLRLDYNPCLSFPNEYKVTFNKGIDPEKLAHQGRFVDIGRFMIRTEYRSNMLVALRLMQKAIKEVVERDYTHFITDVFENEPHSPFRFHTRLLGFEVIGKHLYGELNCSCTRIILTLDILKAYKRIKEKRNKIYYSLLDGIKDLLDEKLLNRVSVQK